jgi:L-ascorbate metabolism protein UlaG (beta-lactamase superfamily)
MDITYLGGKTVKLAGKNLNVIADPATPNVGGKSLAKTTVVSWSTDGLAKVDDAMVLDLPGEYEVGGAMITAVGVGRTTVFSFNIDGVNVVVTGEVGGEVSAESLELLGKVDVLVTPVGEAAQVAVAATLIAKLEPAFVVPVGYDKSPEAFLKEVGVKPEPQPKLKVNARELPTETQVVVLIPTA